MIFFRCDSSIQIGSGHLSRCLSLAEHFRSIGFRSHFICRDLPGVNRQNPRLAPHGVTWIKTDSEEADAEETLRTMRSQGRPEAVIVDHYGLGLSWESSVMGAGLRVMAIDDHLNRPHSADLIFDPNYRSPSERSKHPERVGGPSEALLPAQIRQSRSSAKPDLSERQAGTVLVFFGGTDPTDETTKLLNVLRNSKDLGATQYEVVVSRVVNERLGLQNGPVAPGVRIHVEPLEFSKLLARSDLYLGAGGSVTWERMFLGLPGLVIATAENQEKIAQDLDQDGYQIYLGRAAQMNYENILLHIEGLLRDRTRIESLRTRGFDLVRPISTQRLFQITGKNTPPELTLRDAEAEDSRFLFELRNEPLTRQMSKTTAEVSWDFHQSWFSERLGAGMKAGRLFIATYQGEKVGQFRVDPSGLTSISLVAAARGKNLASEIIRLGVERTLADAPQGAFPEFIAEIRVDNVASARAFQKAEFKLNSSFENEGTRYQSYSLKTSTSATGAGL